MSWAQRLKRVFKLDLQSCEGCGGQLRVIACLEDPLVIGKILAHLKSTGYEFWDKSANSTYRMFLAAD